MKTAHNLDTIIYMLVCASCLAIHCVMAEISQEQLEHFMEVISVRVMFPDELSSTLINRLESFEGDIEPYIRETIKSDIPRHRSRAIIVISVTEDTSLLPLIVDRFLNDGDSSVPWVALSRINWFLERSAPEELFDRETVETLGSRAVEILADETLEIRAVERSAGVFAGRDELKLIKNLKYSKARDLLVDIWNEDREGFQQSPVLETLHEIDPQKADELLHADGVRERLRGKRDNDVAWYLLMARSARNNEHSLEIVRGILKSISEKEEKTANVNSLMLAHGALLTNDEECRRWVFEVLKNKDDANRHRISGALYALQDEPKSIIRSPDEEKALSDAVKMDSRFMRRFSENHHPGMKEGTIGHWLTSPDSPLRD